MNPEKAQVNRQNEIAVWSSFIFLMLAWGSSFILVKKGLRAFNPTELASIRLTIAAIPMLFFAIQGIKKLTKKQILYVILSGITGIFFPAYLFAWAQIGISSSITGVLNALTPCMTFVIGVLFFQQKGTWQKILGLALGFIGSAMLILLNAKGEISLNIYAFCVIGATIFYGLNLNLTKRFIPDVEPFLLSTIAVSFSGILAALYLIIYPNWIDKVTASPIATQSFGAIILLGLLGTTAAQYFFYKMLRLTTAVFASSITYFIPIVAVLWGILDGETFLLMHLLGMCCIIGGIFILNKNK